MSTIYVLTSGSYSNYQVHGVYTTKELAEFAQNIHEPDIYGGDWNIEEFELDGPIDLMSKARQGLYLYTVWMLPNGNSISITRKYDLKENPITEIELDMFFKQNDPFFKCTVFAKDEQHAVKIVNEKRIQYIALNGMPQIQKPKRIFVVSNDQHIEEMKTDT